MTGNRKQHCDSSDCPLAHTLDIVGDKWTLIIIRDMLFCNKHEYKDFMESSEGISTNILADRLKKLEGADIIRSIPHPHYKTRKLYYLTPAGKSFISVLGALIDWADKYLDNIEIPKNDEESKTACMNAIMGTLNEWELEYLGQVQS